MNNFLKLMINRENLFVTMILLYSYRFHEDGEMQRIKNHVGEESKPDYI